MPMHNNTNMKARPWPLANKGPVRSDSGIHKAKEKRARVIAGLLIYAYGVGFSGFQLLLLGIHASGRGHESRIVTIPFRAGFLGLSFLFILIAILTKAFARLGRLWIPLLSFWLLYFLRIVMDGYLNPVPLVQPPIEYIQKAVGVAFIPMFLFMIRLDPKGNRIAFRAFWLVHISCLAVSLLFYNRFFDESYRQLQYYGVDSSTLLSPILLSYIGVVAAAIAFQVVLREISLKSKAYSLFLYIIIIGGIILMLYGGTRSALIILIVVSVIITYRSLSFINTGKAVLAIVLILILGAVLYPIIEKTGSSTITRLILLREQLASGDPAAAGNRLEIYRTAIKQTIQSPLLGRGLEVQEVQAYAHNNIIEAFMATGIFGGISFVFLVSVTLYRCFMILRYRKHYGWIACIFLVFFMRGLFSLSIIDPGFWYSMLAVLTVRIEPTENGANNRRSYRKRIPS